ncbi:hypothetical protein bpSLO_001505 (plasmid) [Borrelia parkeri]|uniref:hypothetical protein n=1 Tax=Borrelia parkeri TaxID=141 RepID=UPI001FF5417D|nr:hypothetical protein [Borrelia parkeri]UPA11626.1 hypothetical protein bpSLO_001505 [Borrelia parkeri]
MRGLLSVVLIMVLFIGCNSDAAVSLLSEIMKSGTFKPYKNMMLNEVSPNDNEILTVSSEAIDNSLEKVRAAFYRAFEARDKVNKLYTQGYFKERELNYARIEAYENWQKYYKNMRGAEEALECLLDKAREAYAKNKNEKGEKGALESWIIDKDKAFETLEKPYEEEEKARKNFVKANSAYSEFYRTEEENFKQAVDILKRAEEEAYKLAENVLKNLNNSEEMKKAVETIKEDYED